MNAIRRIAVLFGLGLASCAPGGYHDRMHGMRKEEVVPVLEAALGPLLLEAGFTRDGGRWTSRRGDAILSVEVAADSHSAVLRAGIGFAPALTLVRSAPSNLNLGYETIPESELLQLYVYRGTGDTSRRGEGESGPFWTYRELMAEALAASATDTVRQHVLPFFKETSTVEEALREVRDEDCYGDCGPLSRFRPRINKFFLAALYCERGDRKRARDVVEKELAAGDPNQPWREFRDWLLQP